MEFEEEVFVKKVTERYQDVDTQIYILAHL